MGSKNTTNKSNKPKGSNFFLCFRPVVLEPDGSGRGGEPVLTYIAVKRNKESGAFPKTSSFRVNDNESLSFGAINKEENMDFPGKKVTGSRRFSHVLKAVLFEASLARKIKKGKSGEKSSRNLLIESARSNNYHKPSNKDDIDFDFRQRIIERRVSALATSSSAATAVATHSNSPCPSCSSSLVTKTTSFVSRPTGSKLRQESQRGYNSCNIGLVLMLLSLLALVFWGKICAIFCTSTWFFFMPRLNGKDNRPIPIGTPPSGKSSENSSECKRKIVMDGLLARGRGSFRCQ